MNQPTTQQAGVMGEQCPGRRPDQTQLEVGGHQRLSPVPSAVAVACPFRDQVTNLREGEASLFLSSHPGDTAHGSCLTALRKKQPSSFIT